MLYARWLQVASDRSGHLALRDLAAGRDWTFADLHAAAEQSSEPPGPVVFARGLGADFVLAVLQGWRWRRLVCPLEPGLEPPPALAAVASGPLPAGLSGCAHLKLTSATTGAPKLIAFTGPQLAADADQLVPTMGLRPERPNLGVISLAHSYGFSNLVTPLLLHGIPLILAGSALPEALRRAAGPLPESTLAGVPALWRVWHDAGAIPPNVTLAISAGAPLPLPLEQAVFAASGLKLHNFYGSSECGGIAYDASATPRTDAACVGVAVQGVSLAVTSEGRLEVRARSVGETYWPVPGSSLGGGCFRTGDLAAMRDGQVRLCGRVSDLINVAGRKVSPETIERALAEHPAVRECLVCSVPAADAGRGEDILAVVVPAGPLSATPLRDWLAQRLPAWQVPRKWRFVEALPVNERGKVARRAPRGSLDPECVEVRPGRRPNG